MKALERQFARADAALGEQHDGVLADTRQRIVREIEGLKSSEFIEEHAQAMVALARQLLNIDTAE